MKAYAGIGSRATPPHILYLMGKLAYELSGRGWTLRSGCADGADSAFEDGAFDAKLTNALRAKPELYLPWPKYNDRRKNLVRLERPTHAAREIAAQYHPAWDRLTAGGQNLHARNVHQILGPDVTNPVLSRFVLCWTEGARGEGGTGQAIRIAKGYGVPVFDLADLSVRERVESGLFS